MRATTNRSVVELMVIVFTLVVAFVIVALGGLVVFVKVAHPESDTETIVTTLLTLSSAILGALLGLIAGKSGRAAGDEMHRRPDGTTDDLEP